MEDGIRLYWSRLVGPESQLRKDYAEPFFYKACTFRLPNTVAFRAIIFKKGRCDNVTVHLSKQYLSLEQGGEPLK